MSIKASSKVAKAFLQYKALLNAIPVRAYSAGVEIERGNLIFSQEKKRQLESVGRIEKINVKVLTPKEEVKLVMNQHISTPHDCAKHISEGVIERSALAQVDETFWDMHAPLLQDCSLRFLTFKDQEPHFLNRAFWRSCSVMLGAIISNAFKDNITVHLHSFPSPNVRSGSFLYDVSLGLKDWSPTKDELRVLSAEMQGLAHKAIPFEKLSVSRELAQKIFQENPFKEEQIPDIAAKSPDGRVTLYRIGEHIEISRGPLIADTSFLGRCTITAVHKIESGSQQLYRFQGVALPKGIMLNHFAFGILEDRAKKLNPGGYPGHQTNEKLASAQ